MSGLYTPQALIPLIARVRVNFHSEASKIRLESHLEFGPQSLARTQVDGWGQSLAQLVCESFWAMLRIAFAKAPTYGFEPIEWAFRQVEKLIQEELEKVKNGPLHERITRDIERVVRAELDRAVQEARLRAEVRHMRKSAGGSVAQILDMEHSKPTTTAPVPQRAAPGRMAAKRDLPSGRAQTGHEISSTSAALHKPVQDVTQRTKQLRQVRDMSRYLESSETGYFQEGAAAIVKDCEAELRREQQALAEMGKPQRAGKPVKPDHQSGSTIRKNLSRTRARTVAKLIGELDQLTHSDGEYDEWKRRHRAFLTFKITDGNQGLRTKVAGVREHRRHILLAQQLAAAYHGRAVSTVKTDWKKHKPKRHRIRQTK